MGKKMNKFILNHNKSKYKMGADVFEGVGVYASREEFWNDNNNWYSSYDTYPVYVETVEYEVLDGDFIKDEKDLKEKNVPFFSKWDRKMFAYEIKITPELTTILKLNEDKIGQYIYKWTCCLPC